MPFPKRDAKWTKAGGWKRTLVFQKTLVQAFADWIRTSGLPRRDRALVALAVLQIAPRYNQYFDRPRFLKSCGLTEEDFGLTTKEND